MKSKASRASSGRSSVVVEQMEGRVFLSASPVAPLATTAPARVASMFLDNRGRAQFVFTVGLDTATLTNKSVGIFTAGADGKLGNKDDVRLATTIGYRKGILTLDAPVTLNQRYRVILNGSRIKDATGKFLDGEFKGEGVASGNGVAGGNTDVMTVAPSKNTRARLATPAGYINVGLYTNTPLTRTNFINYANEKKWDGTIFHRMMKKSTGGGIDIIQAGGFQIGGKKNTTYDIKQSHDDIATEGGNLNLRGTIAMANRGKDPVTGKDTNNLQWYFNVTANPGLDTTPASYTVFGAVDKASQAVLNTLLKFPTSQGTQLPLGSTAGKDVPIKDIPTINKRGFLSPKEDYLIITRVAVLHGVAATAVTPASVAPAAAQVTAAAAPAAQAPATVAPAAKPAAAASVFASKSVIDPDDAGLLA